MLDVLARIRTLGTRAVLAIMAPFEGARRSDSDSRYRLQTRGPNAAMEHPGTVSLGGVTSAQNVTDVVTHEMDNNPVIDAGVDGAVDEVVRTGITLVEPDTGDRNVDERIEALWAQRCKAADVSRTMTMGQVQALYLREQYRAGECGVRIVWAPETVVLGRRHAAGPAVELIPSERIPRTLSGVAPTGNEVRGGVEIKDGQVVAYWVLRAVPNDQPVLGALAGYRAGYTGGAGGAWSAAMFGGLVADFGDPALERVPIAEMVLRFRSRRAAAVRGVSRLVSVLTDLRNERTYMEATMTIAKNAARIGVIMSAKNAAAFNKVDKNGDAPLMLGADGRPPVEIGTGPSFLFVQDAQGVTQIASDLPGQTFADTEKVMLRRVSRGLRRTAAAVSGDFEQVNYAGARMDALDRSKAVERDQDDVWQMTEPFYRVGIDHDVLTGRLEIPAELRAKWAKSPLGDEALYNHAVTAPAIGYSDPRNEAAANETDIRAGVKSRAEACRERGTRWRQVVDDEIELEKYQRERRAEEGLPEKTAATAAGVDTGRDEREDQSATGNGNGNRQAGSGAAARGRQMGAA